MTPPDKSETEETGGTGTPDALILLPAPVPPKRYSAHEKDGHCQDADKDENAVRAKDHFVFPVVFYELPETGDGDNTWAAWRLPALPAALTGADGVNRGYGPAQIAADEDRAAICAWLDMARSPRTREAYQREAERLLLWCYAVRGEPLSSLLLEDLQAYFAFCADPPKDWCGPRKPRLDPAWRPFHDKTTERARRGKRKSASWGQAVAILSALFTFLVEVGYLEKNPMAIMRRSARGSRRRAQRVTRLLSHAEWELVQEYIDALPETPAIARARKERILFMFSFLYLLVPRLNDLVTHTMGSFERNTRGKWYWKVVGKGDKEASLPVNKKMLHALERYRVSLGREPHPLPDEKTPLVPDIKDPKRGLSPNRIYRIVKWVFAKTAERVAVQDPVAAEKLRRASTHWLRHTGASHALDRSVDLRHVSKMLRHADLQTTSIYTHSEDQRWEDDMEKHGWR